MSRWVSLRDRISEYGQRVFSEYYSVVSPLLMLLACAAAVSMHTHDMEKEGMLWLHYTSLSEEERSTQFPNSEKDGIQKRSDVNA